MGIKCCKNCVPPKRHPGCWGTCPEYIKEKEQWDKYREEDRIQREVCSPIYDRREKRYMKSIVRRRYSKLK